MYAEILVLIYGIAEIGILKETIFVGSFPLGLPEPCLLPPLTYE